MPPTPRRSHRRCADPDPAAPGPARPGVMVAGTDAKARSRFREAWRSIRPTCGCARRSRTWPSRARNGSTRARLASAAGKASARLAFRNALVADAQAPAATGHIDDACARLREAIAAAVADVETLATLAGITPDAEEAERATEQAFALDPNDERAIAAMDRLRSLRIDPATLEPPADAFARFGDAPEDGEDALAPIESGFEAFAELAGAPQGVQPSVAPAPSFASAGRSRRRRTHRAGLDAAAVLPRPADLTERPVPSASVARRHAAAARRPRSRRTGLPRSMRRSQWISPTPSRARRRPGRELERIVGVRSAGARSSRRSTIYRPPAGLRAAALAAAAAGKAGVSRARRRTTSISRSAICPSRPPASPRRRRTS